jgi:hypothetical protein
MNSTLPPLMVAPSPWPLADMISQPPLILVLAAVP